MGRRFGNESSPSENPCEMTLKKHNFYPGDIPVKPGCYLYRDRFGEVIYVGKGQKV